MRANGTAIKAIRRDLGMSLRDLEASTGINRGVLSKIENGVRDARVKTLVRIASGLQVTPYDISHDEFAGIGIPQ